MPMKFYKVILNKTATYLPEISVYQTALLHAPFSKLLQELRRNLVYTKRIRRKSVLAV